MIPPRYAILALILCAQTVANVGPLGIPAMLMAELAGSRSAGTAVGLGLAVSSLGVTVAPPLFGSWVERLGSYRGPWIGLAARRNIEERHGFAGALRAWGVWGGHVGAPHFPSRAGAARARSRAPAAGLRG